MSHSQKEKQPMQKPRLENDAQLTFDEIMEPAKSMIGQTSTNLKSKSKDSQNSQDQRQKYQQPLVEIQQAYDTSQKQNSGDIDHSQIIQLVFAKSDEQQIIKQQYEHHKRENEDKIIERDQEISKLSKQNQQNNTLISQLQKENLQYKQLSNNRVSAIRELIDSLQGKFDQLNSNNQLEDIKQHPDEQSFDRLLKSLCEKVQSMISLIQNKIEQFNFYEDQSKKQTEIQNKRLQNQIEEAKKKLNQLTEKIQAQKQEKAEIKRQKQRIEKISRQTFAQKVKFQTSYSLKKQQFQILRKKYQKQVQAHKNLTQSYQKQLNDLKDKYQQKHTQLQKLFQQKYFIMNNQYTDKQYKYINQRQGIEKELRQTIQKLQRQIQRINLQKLKIEDDWKTKYDFVSERQQNHQKQLIKFEQMALNNLNNLIFNASKSSQQRNKSYLQTNQRLQASLKEQITKGEEYADYILQLEEQIVQLTTEKNQNYLNLQYKTTQIVDCNLKIEELNEQISNLKQRESLLKKKVDLQLQKIKKELQSKLTTSLTESSSFYEKILKQNNQKFTIMQQTSNIQLELTVKSKDLKLECLRQNEQKQSQYISALQREINELNQRTASQIQHKNKQIEHLNGQLNSLKDNFRVVQQHKDLQEKHAQKLHQKLALFKKTLLHIHSQLQNKKLIDIIKNLDGKEEQYHRGLLDLVNSICYSQDQLNNRAELLEISLNKITGQKGSLISKLNSSEKALTEKLQQIERQKRGLQEQTKKKAEEIAKIKQDNKSLQEQIKSMKQKVLSAEKEKEIMIQAQSQISKTTSLELNRAKARISELEKNLLQNKNFYEASIKQFQIKIDEEKKKTEQSSSRNNDANSLQLKIKELSRQNDQLKDKNKQLQSSQKLVEQNRAIQKDQAIKNLTLEKVTIESDLLQTKIKLSKSQQQRQQLKKKLKTRDQQLNNRRSSILITSDSEKLALSEQNKQLQTQVKNLLSELNQLKKSNKTMEQIIDKLKDQCNQQKQRATTNTENRKVSWNKEKEEESMSEGYLNIVHGLKVENQLLEEQIKNLKEKIKRLQSMNTIPKSFISPPKSIIMQSKSLQRVNYPSTNINQKQESQSKISPKQQNLFSVSCLLDNNQKVRFFLSRKIQDIYSNKKIMETKLIYKDTEANKNISFNTLLSKEDLAIECFLFLFSARSSIFGVLSYKKDSLSKQSAFLFSADNLKLVFKKADASTTAAVSIDFGGDLLIGNGHIRMKSSQRLLIVKEPSSNRYFDYYDKKEIFGKEYWRDQMSIDIKINEFQIHRIYFKAEN